jgi:hypothetical protein
LSTFAKFLFLCKKTYLQILGARHGHLWGGHYTPYTKIGCKKKRKEKNALFQKKYRRKIFAPLSKDFLNSI